MKKNLVIINNEKCSIKNGEIFCENIEIKSLNENLKSKYDVKFLLREGNTAPVYKIEKPFWMRSNVAYTSAFLPLWIFVLNWSGNDGVATNAVATASATDGVATNAVATAGKTAGVNVE